MLWAGHGLCWLLAGLALAAHIMGWPLSGLPKFWDGYGLVFPRAELAIGRSVHVLASHGQGWTWTGLTLGWYGHGPVCYELGWP